MPERDTQPDVYLSMPRVLVRTYVDPEIRRRFTEQFPMDGAISWVLEAAMTEILSITDGQPPLVEVVRDSIRLTILQRKLQRRVFNGESRSPDDSVTIERV